MRRLGRQALKKVWQQPEPCRAETIPIKDEGVRWADLARLIRSG